MGKVFITGVSAGIGQALAEKYLAQGYEVYGVSRRTPETLLGRPNFFFRSVDLYDAETIPTVLEHLLATAGTLDVVVLNAAAVGKIADLKDTTSAECQQLMQLNVWANKVVLDSLFSFCSGIRQVVAVSSCAAIAAFRGTPCYCISKASLNMLIALYAEERKETHFSVIAPGLVETEMQEQIASRPEADHFPSLVFLKTMRAGGCMLKPQDAAGCLLSIFDDALVQKSGSFIDASSTMAGSTRSIRSRHTVPGAA